MELLLFIVIAVAVWMFMSYNKLRRLAEYVKRCRANIAASIKKRHDIAQRLSDIAASYGDHEKLTHITVTEGDLGIAQASAAAADATRVIGNVQMVANRFPELKANATYQQLMVQLEEIENAILQRREAYNEAAQTYNSTRGSLPHLFYSDALGFAEAPYFAVDDSDGEQLASFNTDDGRILRETMGRMASAATTHAQTAASRLKTANDHWAEQRAAENAATAAAPSENPTDSAPPPRS